MIQSEREVMQAALDALTYQGTMGPTRRARRTGAITALRAALAQPDTELQLAANLLQEYGLQALDVVAEFRPTAALVRECQRIANILDDDGDEHGCAYELRQAIATHTDTPQRTAYQAQAKLTDEEILDCISCKPVERPHYLRFARMIEAKIRGAK